MARKRTRKKGIDKEKEKKEKGRNKKRKTKRNKGIFGTSLILGLFGGKVGCRSLAVLTSSSVLRNYFSRYLETIWNTRYRTQVGHMKGKCPTHCTIMLTQISSFLLIVYCFPKFPNLFLIQSLYLSFKSSIAFSCLCEAYSGFGKVCNPL